MLVPEKGLEPSQPFGHWNLNPARLPISPLGHTRGLLRIITIVMGVAHGDIEPAIRENVAESVGQAARTAQCLLWVLQHGFPADARV